MKFRILSYFLTLITAVSFLTSCHGKLESTNSDNKSENTEITEDVLNSNYKVPDNFDTSIQHELTFWAKNDTNKIQTAIYEKAISDFEKLYPNVKIKLRLYNDYGKIYNDVITNISTDTTPNICITYPDHIATYISGNETVVRLNELMVHDKYGLGGELVSFDSPSKDEIVPAFLSECSFGDKYYALPFMRSSEACYINKTLLENLGYTIPDSLTWDFIWEVSEAALKKDESGNYIANGQNVLIPFIYKSTDNMMIQMLKQLNAPYSSENGEIYIFNEKTADILREISVHAKSRAFSTFKISSYPGNYLNANQCIFAIDSTAGSTWIGANAPLSDLHDNQIAEFETEVRMLPQFDPKNPKMISQGPSVCIFNKKDPQEVLASWLFMQYLLTNDIQISYSQTEGYIPVTLKAQNSAEYQDYLSRIGEDNFTYYDVKIKASKLVLDNIPNTFVTPVFNGSASLRNASGQMIENVSKSVRRKETIDDNYINTLFKDMISLYHLENISSKDNSDTLKDTAVSELPKASFSNLPTESKILITVFVIIWIIIGLYSLNEMLKKRKTK